MEYFVGVDVGGSKTLVVLAAREAEGEFAVLDRERVPTRADSARELVLEGIRLAIDAVLARNGLSGGGLCGIGIVVPGPVDRRRGLVVDCVNVPALAKVDLPAVFGALYGVPVAVSNDAHAATLAEARSGAGAGYEHFVYIGLGTGVGCGIVIGRRLYTGADGAAGELSHMLFPGLGTLHEIASGKAIRKLFDIEAELLAERIAGGDGRAREAIDHLVRYLGAGLANVVTLFNPEALVLGGGLANLGPALLSPLESEIRSRAFSIAGRSFAFFRARYLHDAGALGAAYLCEEKRREKEKRDRA